MSEASEIKVYDLVSTDDEVDSIGNLEGFESHLLLEETEVSLPPDELPAQKEKSTIDLAIEELGDYPSNSDKKPEASSSPAATSSPSNRLPDNDPGLVLRRTLKNEATLTSGIGKHAQKKLAVETFWNVLWPALSGDGWTKVRVSRSWLLFHARLVFLFSFNRVTFPSRCLEKDNMLGVYSSIHHLLA
jgi:hypothetical protein